jgi:large subunit ribosomal protein L6
MSKIGRKPIDASGVQVELKDNQVIYNGPKASGMHELPGELAARLDGNTLNIVPGEVKKASSKIRDINRLWGLHRALLFNKINGARKEFATEVQINGLGFKAVASGSKLVFSLGYSHKIDFNLPKSVTVDIDKTGQKLVIKSSDRELVGQVCSDIKALRATEPYKGTGIKLASDVILRKAGKTKSS